MLRLFLVALTILATASFTLPGAAQTGPRGGEEAEMFVVTGIPVSETGRSAAEAREKAIEAGQIEGLRRVMERLVAPGTADRLPNVPDAQVPSMVQAIELNNEQTAGTRYRARMTVRFFPEAVRRVLRDAGATFAEQPAPAALVLAVYSADGGDHLWEEPNPWREAWSRHGRGSPLVPLLMPYGELADIQAISAQEALAGADQALDRIAGRYDVENVLVVHAMPGRGGSVDVAVNRYWVGQGMVLTDRFQASSGEEGLRSAVGRVIDGIGDQVRAGSTMRPDARTASTVYGVPSASPGMSRLSTRVGFSGLRQWQQIQRTLGELEPITELQIDAISAEDAQLVLSFSGTTEQLRELLSRSNLLLRSDGPYWAMTVLDPARDVRPAPPQAPAAGMAVPPGSPAVMR